jgi:hypothetical protein
MKLIGNLKDKVEQANSKEEARNIISEAGMKLTMDELDMVVGGGRGMRRIDNPYITSAKNGGPGMMHRPDPIMEEN